MPRFAFLSLAHIHARFWLDDVKKSRDQSIAAIWDDVAERGKREAARVQAPFVADLDRVLADTSVDAFVVCAENTRHLPILRQVLAVGKPVLCEKPLATTAVDATEIRALVERHRTILVNGYSIPFLAPYRAVAAALHAGALGRVTHARFRNAHHGAWARWFDDPHLSWFHDVRLAGGGALLDEGTHGVHLLRMLFGPIRSVWAVADNLSKVYPSADDFGVMHVRFASGVFATIEASWVHTAGPKGLEVWGSRAGLWAEDDRYVISPPEGPAVPLASAPAAANTLDRLAAAVRGELDLEEYRRDLDSALAAVVAMEAAYRSAKSGGWVEVTGDSGRMPDGRNAGDGPACRL